MLSRHSCCLPAAGLLRALVLAVTALVLTPTVASAQEKKTDPAAEERARGLINDAMEQDYLGVNFKAAEAKLHTALRVCEMVCSKELVAKIHRALGVVYAAMDRHEDAVESLKAMIHFDAKLGLDPNFLNADVQKAFDEAKEASKATIIEKSLVVLEEEPWAEQAVNTPVPVYVETPEGFEGEIGKVVVRFMPPNAKRWQEVELAPVSNGYGGYVPCTGVAETGELKYFVTAFDENLDRLASAGSSSEPRRVKIKSAITGRQPSLPDSTPPSPCPTEDKGLSCSIDDDCPGSMVCVDLYCVEEASIPKEVDPREKVKSNWLTLQFSPDLMLVKSQQGVCNNDIQAQGQYSCFFAGDRQVDSDADRITGGGNSTLGGIGVGSMRLLVGYDRVFLKRMLVGARVGFAFLGHPDREISGGGGGMFGSQKFLPIHFEARYTFHLWEDPFAETGIRPYAFAGGGIADSSAVVRSDVLSENAPNEVLEVDVYQLGGPYHVSFGIGAQYAVQENMAMVLEVGVRQHFGEVATVLAPSLGFTYGL